MQEKCLKILSYTSELLCYSHDCLKIILKDYFLIGQKMDTLSTRGRGMSTYAIAALERVRKNVFCSTITD